MVFTDALLHHHFNEISLGFEYLGSYNKTHTYESIADKDKNIIVGIFLNVITSGFSLIENFTHMIARDFYYRSISRKRPIDFDENEKLTLHGYKVLKEKKCEIINDLCPHKHKNTDTLKIDEMLKIIPELIYKKTGHEKYLTNVSSLVELSNKTENFIKCRPIRNAITHGGYDSYIKNYYNEDEFLKEKYYQSLFKRYAFRIEEDEFDLGNGKRERTITSQFKLRSLSVIAFDCSIAYIELYIALNVLIRKAGYFVNEYIILDEAQWNYIDFACFFCKQLSPMYIKMIKGHYKCHDRLFILDH